jgi:hypothetical protein
MCICCGADTEKKVSTIGVKRVSAPPPVHIDCRDQIALRYEAGFHDGLLHHRSYVELSLDHSSGWLLNRDLQFIDLSQPEYKKRFQELDGAIQKILNELASASQFEFGHRTKSFAWRSLVVELSVLHVPPQVSL